MTNHYDDVDTPSTRFERGRARQASMRPVDVVRSAVFDGLATIAPDVARLATEFAYGDIHDRPGLDSGRRELVILAVLASLGDVDDQIRSHTGSALGAGVTADEVVEALIQTIPYIGFPRAIHALTAAGPALHERTASARPTPTTTHPDHGGHPMTHTATPTASPTSSYTQLCHRFFASIDQRDWDTFERCLAPHVTTDFSGLWGGEPEQTTPHELREAWSVLFSSFAATQHQVGGYVLQPPGENDAPVVLSAAFRATHFGHDPYGSPSWTLYGFYRIELTADADNPRIRGLHQTPTAGEGNRNIVRIAANT